MGQPEVVTNLVTHNVGNDLSRHPSPSKRPCWREVGDSGIRVAIEIENTNIGNPATPARVGDRIVVSGNDGARAEIDVEVAVAINRIVSRIFGCHIDVERGVILRHQRPSVDDRLALGCAEVARVSVVIKRREHRAIGNIRSVGITRQIPPRIGQNVPGEVEVNDLVGTGLGMENERVRR